MDRKEAINNKCSDCGLHAHEFIVECSSLLTGAYYKGPPICSDCAGKRYYQALEHAQLNGISPNKKENTGLLDESKGGK